MNPTPLHATARAVGGAALVLALAAGCSAGTDDEPTPGSEAPVGEQDDPGADDEATSDGGGASDEGGSASDEGGAEGAAAGGQELPEDADLATEQLPVTAECAIEIATETVGGGELVQIEIDHDDRTWEWELELVMDGTEHELDIDATTGEVTEHETDDDDDRDPAVDVTSPMAYAEAIEIALGQEPGRVSGWELDSEDGQIRYQIDIDRAEGGDVEVEVDVETGDVRIDD